MSGTSSTRRLLAEALARLSRDQKHIAALFKQLSIAGIRIFTLAEGEISELHVGLKGTMNALFLKDLRAKVNRGMEGRVRAGKSGGGLGYGYRAVRQLDARGDVVRGDRAVDEAEAVIVRRIFERFVAGESPRAIVKRLNEERIPGPYGHQWNMSTIHGNRQRGTGILNNELYIGRLVWNRRRFVKDPTTGRRIGRPNDERDWVVEMVPELRIVDQPLWDAAKARQREIDKLSRAVATNALNITHRRRFLLSRLLRCGLCGSSYTIGGHDRYLCAGNRERGTCENHHAVRRDEIEGRVLDGLKERLLAPELVAEFVRTIEEEFTRRKRAQRAQDEANRCEIEAVDRKIEAVLRAIEDGVYTAPTRQRLLDLEQCKANLERMPPLPPALTLHPCLSEVYGRKVAALRESLNDPEIREEASEILRSPIREITLTPVQGENRLLARLHSNFGGVIAICEENRGVRRPNAPVVSLVAGERYHLYRTHVTWP